MKKTNYCWSIIILLIALLILINVNFKNSENIISYNNNDPTYQSDRSNTTVYNKEGILNYHLSAQHIEFFLEQRISKLFKPTLIIYDKDEIKAWSIKSDLAKMKKSCILYLYGHVEIDVFLASSILRKIITDSVRINMITLDIVSKDLVVLYGIKFHSQALKMYGNLKNKNIELIEKVKTFYEI